MQILSLFTIDEFGVDPISSSFFDVVKSVRASTTYRIPSSEHLNPALTSYLRYKSKSWWQFILAFNDIGDLWEYTEGRVIRLPDINEMTNAIMRDITVKPERIVSI